MFRTSLAAVIAFSACAAVVAGEPPRPADPHGIAFRPAGSSIRPALSHSMQSRVSTSIARPPRPASTSSGSLPTDRHHRRECRPHDHRHSGLVFRSYIFSGYPAYYGSLYGYDPYGAESLRDENGWLYRELRALQEQNEALQEQLQQRAAGVKAEVPDGRRRAAAERAKQSLLIGMRLFKAGDYRRAADRFTAASKAAPDDATPQFFRALALFAAGQFAPAVESLKAGMRIGADWPLADFDVKQLYGNPDELVAQLAQLAAELKANPLDRDRLFLLGFVLFVTDEPAKAKPLLEQAARLEADDAHLKPFLDYYQRQDAALPQAAANPAGPKPEE